MIWLILQAARADKPAELISSVEEELKSKPAVVLQRSREDYYGSLSNTCRDSHSSDTPMDRLKVTLHALICLSLKRKTEFLSYYSSNPSVRIPLRPDTLSPPLPLRLLEFCSIRRRPAK